VAGNGFHHVYPAILPAQIVAFVAHQRHQRAEPLFGNRPLALDVVDGMKLKSDGMTQTVIEH